MFSTALYLPHTTRGLPWISNKDGINNIMSPGDDYLRAHRRQSSRSQQLVFVLSKEDLRRRMGSVGAEAAFIRNQTGKPIFLVTPPVRSEKDLARVIKLEEELNDLVTPIQGVTLVPLATHQRQQLQHFEDGKLARIDGLQETINRFGVPLKISMALKKSKNKSQ